MTPAPILTRSQQRTQKRQAWVMLLLVVGVAIGSFVLGVVVGRSSRLSIQDRREELAAQPIVRPVPLPPRDTAATTPTVSAETSAAASTLSKGEQPLLGSGINLPQSAQVGPAKSAVAVAPQEAAQKDTRPPVPAAKVEPKPEGNVEYQVLVASFPGDNDAGDFLRRLERKGYQGSLTPSTVQGKTWYRVAVGPYGDYATAKAAAERLQREDRVAPIIRKRRP